MKRWAFIIGIVIITILSAVWLYLLFFGPTTNSSLFNAFNFGDTTEEGVTIDTPEERPVVDTTSPQRLRQLTLRKVIGHTEVSSTTASTSRVYFAEAGTGHIYTIDITSGVEERISNITIPMADSAVFSADGSFAAISAAGAVSLVTLPTTETELASLELGSGFENLSFTEDAALVYTLQTISGTQGKAYNLSTKTTKTLFEVPFRNVRANWGSGINSTHYVYPATSAYLEGYYYEIKNGVMNRLPASGFGFSAATAGDYTLFTKRQSDVTASHLLNNQTKGMTLLGMILLPEKCVFTDNTALCGVGEISNDRDFPDSWYKGVVVSSDDLWTIDLTNGALTMVLDLEQESARMIDTVQLNISNSSERVYFVNKIDQALWLYDATIIPPQ